MKFYDLLLWLEDNNKAQFVYNSRYYDFIFNISRDGQDFFYAVLFHGRLAYFSWQFAEEKSLDSIHQNEKSAYLDFIKEIVIDKVPIGKIIDDRLYEPGSLRKIKGSVSKNYHRNTNTVAELFALNLQNMDASVLYKDDYFGIWGSVRGDYHTAKKEDYYDLYFELVHNKEEVRKVSKESCSFTTQESVYIEFEDLDQFYPYLHQVKLDGIYLEEILEKELFEEVDMAI